jgi:putative DNA primase/helicase
MLSTKADQIMPARPVWLWGGWLAAGALHVLVGRQGGGKSTFAAWLIAQVTTGRPYPDDGTHPGALNAATLSLEEPADRLVARLHAAGADVGRVDVLADVEDQDKEGRDYRRPWRLPQDCAALETFLLDGEVRLLIVDGLGYSITGDSHNYAVVGSALSALAGVAERTGCAIVGLTHPPKGSADPTTAAIGSTAWTAIPRVVYVLGADPGDESEQRRVVRVSKTNYRPPATGIGFVIDNDERHECGRVNGLSLSTVTAESLVAARQTEGERTERENARDLVKSILEAGPVDTAEVLRIANEAGVSKRTLERVRSDLGVTPTKLRDPETGRLIGWQLALPTQSAAPIDLDGGPARHPLFGGVGGLDPTREYVSPHRPESHPRESGVLASAFDGSPWPDDSMSFSDEETEQDEWAAAMDSRV